MTLTRLHTHTKKKQESMARSKANTQEDHVKQRKTENCYQIYILFMNIESPPSMHPPLRICDITGFEVRVSVEMCLVLELADEIHHYF